MKHSPSSCSRSPSPLAAEAAADSARKPRCLMPLRPHLHPPRGRPGPGLHNPRQCPPRPLSRSWRTPSPRPRAEPRPRVAPRASVRQQGTFDPRAYGDWLTAVLPVPGRYYDTADAFEFHIPGRVLGEAGSPTAEPGAATFLRSGRRAQPHRQRRKLRRVSDAVRREPGLHGIVVRRRRSPPPAHHEREHRLGFGSQRPPRSRPHVGAFRLDQHGNTAARGFTGTSTTAIRWPVASRAWTPG